MNDKITCRGYTPSDKKEFSESKLIILKKAQSEIRWLLDKEYSIKSITEFVGNHYLLSKRQRLALMRSTSSTTSIDARKIREAFYCKEKTVNIDGFNLIITLEIALSNSTLIKCMDGTIRDLAGLRGTYRLIDKTDRAIILIGEKLKAMNVASAVFYLDEPVSNSGGLKAKVLELLDNFNFDVSVELVKNADSILKNKAYIITTDAIILNDCISWINLANDIVNDYGFKYIDLS